ncbi:MAG: 3-oxoacyl-ACP reductase family protein [Planctomycetota bacterium]|nr:3-oxoacyl-ACP reductase family protein [Planctomycetota bacterium]MEC9010447.1 3-oxoacyl-ACP reductase family protein [Planctomycetota bacterium]MED5399457.1 3-oxoacyl-ACP reductase family protein [Planctomycetota bacterium]MED5447085.1 3-oxoacyl-ACP reductase family protein [Planctomycetota bacterium]MEE3283315.1 3-oxoacyl-ACP reductase family protein [Planctomycetota bacterium]
MSDYGIEGRVALVTGGSRGIGRAISEQLAAAGARVAVNYRSDHDAAAETVAAIQSAGGTATAVAADVSNETDVDRLIADVDAALGPVDLLVNNAGIFDYGDHHETTVQLWHRTIAVNLTSAFLVSWAVKDGMIQRGYGRIVNVASIAALRPRPNSIAYAASKAGMVGLTRSLAEGVAGDGVRVNAIAPGLIETDILADVDKGVLDELVEATPMKRIGQPCDIASVTLFLLGDDSNFMTGQTLVASGGRVMLP